MRKIEKYLLDDQHFEAFFHELKEILIRTGGINSSSWKRAAAQHLQGMASYHELLRVLDDEDPNTRILVADVIGRVRHSLTEQGKEQIISRLCRLLGDPATNDYGYAGFQSDEDSVYFVSGTAAESLVRLGYAENVHAVFAKARKAGFEVEECYNIP